jgi:multisubunit Na+/H+ antiporter MnhG subunit
MKRLSILTLILAALSVVFGVILVFLRTRFPLYPLVSYQDVLGILTPLIFTPIYWLMFKRAANTQTGPGQ